MKKIILFVLITIALVGCTEKVSALTLEEAQEIALKEVEGKDSVMMLMHDGGGNEATVKALPTIIKNLKKQGYEFKVIDATTPVFHHHIAN